jgi:predicted GNAT family acetyltransferase
LNTGVADELGGQGLGKQLVEAVVNYARENNLKIIAFQLTSNCKPTNMK